MRFLESEENIKTHHNLVKTSNIRVPEIILNHDYERLSNGIVHEQG